MVRSLSEKGIKVPPGFATTAGAYWNYVEVNGLRRVIVDSLKAFSAGHASLAEIGATIRHEFLRGTWPKDLAEAIQSAYRQLCLGADLQNRADEEIRDIDVAVRSSATAEDIPDASFAGQHESFLNIRGEAALLDACRRCYASLFTDRAISYRLAKGFDHMKVALSIGVQRMVRSDLGSSGVIFSIDTETGFDKVVLINAGWGLGENIVQGAIDPDEYEVFKPFLSRASLIPIIEKKLGGKEKKMIYATGAERPTRNVPTSRAERARFVLDDKDILQLARWACTIEEHYGCPMDMEWAKDGETGGLFIVQARPETVQSRREASTLRSYHIKSKGRRLLSGLSIGDAVVSGRVCLIENPKDISRFIDGAILVTRATDPDWVPIMQRAAALVTDHGGRTSHAAIVSRELGLPAIVGTEDATHLLHDEQEITVSCAEGDEGFHLRGSADFETSEIDFSKTPTTRTKLMLNMANPAAAFRWWRMPTDGVGLARMEFVVGSHIKVHPMALAHYDALKDRDRQSNHCRINCRLRRKDRVFCRPACAGTRSYRCRLLSQPGDRAHERFQDQRIRQLDRRRRIRTEGREPDARVPRRVALLFPSLSRWLCSRMPRHPAPAGGNGISQRYRHDSVLPLHQGGRPRARGDGEERIAPRRKRPPGLRHVRDSLERHPGEGFCRALRWLLDRQQRSYAAHLGRGSRFRGTGGIVRRARRRREMDDPQRDRRGSQGRRQGWPVRSGAERSSRVR